MAGSSGGRRPGVPGDDGAAGPTSARGGASDAAASSGEAVIASETISSRSGGDALLAVRVDDVDGDVAKLAFVLAGVVPAENEVTSARENNTHLGQCTTTVAVEGHDQVVGGRGRRQRLGHLVITRSLPHGPAGADRPLAQRQDEPSDSRSVPVMLGLAGDGEAGATGAGGGAAKQRTVAGSYWSAGQPRWCVRSPVASRLWVRCSV